MSYIDAVSCGRVRGGAGIRRTLAQIDHMLSRGAKSFHERRVGRAFVYTSHRDATAQGQLFEIVGDPHVIRSVLDESI